MKSGAHLTDRGAGKAWYCREKYRRFASPDSPRMRGDANNVAARQRKETRSRQGRRAEAFSP
eukprot:1040815-Rhodomonas_salina.2